MTPYVPLGQRFGEELRQAALCADDDVEVSVMKELAEPIKEAPLSSCPRLPADVKL